MEVSNYNDAKQVLSIAGFKFFESCQCGGSLQHKWNKGRTQVKVFPNKNPAMFQVVNINTGLISFTGNLNQFEKAINEIPS